MRFKQKLLICLWIAGISSFIPALSITKAVSATDVGYEVNIENAINMTIDDTSVLLNLNPFNNDFDTADLNVAVGTNNPTGYTLTMYALSRDLTKSDGTDIIPTLSSMPGGYSEEQFRAQSNAWGYKLPSTNYLPFKGFETIATSGAPSATTTSTITFATKVDTSKSAGIYELTITFAATANYVPISSIDELTYVQDFATLSSSEKNSVLGSMATGAAYSLIDSRDSEVYKISKLADGNAWFLDNLRLDLTDRDLVNGMDAENTNATTESIYSLRFGGNRSQGAQYANNGLTYSNWTTGQSYSAPLVNISGQYCTAWELIEEEMESDIVCTGTTENYTKDTVVTSYGTGSGKMGVFYNFCAASAGTYCYGDGEQNYGSPSGNANEDICPAGWRLPVGGNSTSETNEFKNLYTAYNEDASAFDNALSLTLSGILYNGSDTLWQNFRADFFSSLGFSGMDSAVYGLAIHEPSYQVPVQTYVPVMRIAGAPVRCVLK